MSHGRYLCGGVPPWAALETVAALSGAGAGARLSFGLSAKPFACDSVAAQVPM